MAMNPAGNAPPPQSGGDSDAPPANSPDDDAGAPVDDPQTVVAANSPVPAIGAGSPPNPLDRPQAIFDQMQRQLPADIKNIQMPQIPGAGQVATSRKAPAGKYGVANVDKFPTDATFDPAFADKLSGAIAEMNAQGIKPTITKGFRTAVEQKHDVDQAKDPSNNPAAKVSWHQAGQAVDINHYDKNFPAILNIMQKHGFVWGGMFSPRHDPVHFQLAPKGTRPTSAMVSATGGD